MRNTTTTQQWKCVHYLRYVYIFGAVVYVSQVFGPRISYLFVIICRVIFWNFWKKIWENHCHKETMTRQSKDNKCSPRVNFFFFKKMRYAFTLIISNPSQVISHECWRWAEICILHVCQIQWWQITCSPHLSNKCIKVLIWEFYTNPWERRFWAWLPGPFVLLFAAVQTECNMVSVHYTMESTGMYALASMEKKKNQMYTYTSSRVNQLKCAVLFSLHIFQKLWKFPKLFDLCVW